MPGHLNGCNCQACKDYHNRATKLYHLRQAARARGEVFAVDLVDASDVRRLILAAKKHGRTYYEMNRMTGLSRECLLGIAHGKTKRVQRRTAIKVQQALADPTVRAPADNSLVPITVERQIVRSLHAQGWTTDHQTDIIRNNNMGSGVIITTLMHRDTEKAIWRNLKQVHWLAGAIGNRTGPSRQTRALMLRKGVFPLQHYDPRGKLILSTLSDEQRKWVRS